MTGTLSIAFTRAGGVVTTEAELTEKQDFSVGRCVKHIAKKANYKHQAGGQWVQRGWCNFIRRNIEGNTADDRYRRAAYESSQRNTSALLAERYRAELASPCRSDYDLSDNTLVKSRMMRQDNIRFNPQLQQNRTMYDFSERNGWAVRLSRWAHTLNGVTELGAAPTGMLLKSSRFAFTPNRDDRSSLAQLRVMGALVVIAGVVSLFGVAVFKNSLGRIANKVPQALAADVSTIVASFSALSAISAIGSLAFSGASVLCASNSRLGTTTMKVLESNQRTHVDRLFAILDHLKGSPDGLTMLSKALQAKIGTAYLKEGQPVLLTRLLADVNAANGDEYSAKSAMRKTLGAYQVEKDFTGEQTGDLLTADKNKGELLRRENHVVALTNLIEHNRIHSTASDNVKDLRHNFEDGVKASRTNVIASTASLLNVLGFKDRADRVLQLNSPEFIKDQLARKNDSSNAVNRYNSADYMLDHPHQYGPFTRALMKSSEFVRVFNHGVLLSLNYQVTRPVAWLAGRVTENLLQNPNSRTVSFSIGRAVSSSVWAVFDALVLINLSAGREAGFTGSDAQANGAMPWRIPLGIVSLPISVISTATQMFVVSVPSFMLMMAAKGVSQLEGWKGTEAPMQDAVDSKRKPLYLGSLAD